MMRRETEICLFCRHVFKSHNQAPLRRYASAPNHEPYILPRLVIDLDANDSRFVRQAKEKDYAVPDKPPRRVQYDPRVGNNNDERTLRNSRPLHAFDLHAVTSPDLLQYALLGSPFAYPQDNNLSLRKVFTTHRIHPLDNADSKLKRLAFKFTTNSSKLVENMGLTPERQEQVARQIKTCPSFSDLRRMVSAISSTTEGCEFLAREGSHLRGAIKNLRSKASASDGHKTPNAIDTLKFYNSLIQNMQSKGVEPGVHMYNAVLRYACIAFSLTSVHNYLGVLCDKKYPLVLKTARAVTKLAVHSRRNRSITATHNHRLSWERQNQEVLRLIAGWQANGNPRPGEKRQPSFGAQICAPSKLSLRMDIYSKYVVSLGYMGASDALWYEWENSPRNVSVLRPSMFRARGEIQEEPEIFALAFLMAKDPDRALISLNAALETPIDAQEKPAYFLSDQTRQALVWYYISNGLDPTERLKERLKMDISPRTPEAVLEALNDMLVPQWLESVEAKEAPTDSIFRYSIDWLEQGGREGLAIMKPGDGEVVYSRLSS